MKINNVLIENWKAPGATWWNGVESKPDEPLIEATITFKLSFNEYRKLLDHANESESTEASVS